jgi:3-oxoacyl-[acyl-carrier protein] reductase
MNSKKVALVTGASRGIGRAIALELAKQDFLVIGTATTAEGADKISAAFKEHSLSGQGFALDITNPDSVDTLLQTLSQDFGAPAILVNNAGVTCDNIMLRMKDEEWDKVINTNLTAVYRLTKACLKPMLKAQWGRIINITSVVGATGNPGQVNYAAAKAGLVGFTKSLAQEIASRNITVNAVAPGFIDTDMTKNLSEEHKKALLQKIPLSRLGRPEDIASAVAFLASPQAEYITGQTLHVNGGMYMSD